METYYIIYKITNKINGKVYIGCHKTKNLDDGYMGSGKYLKYSHTKHGMENFSKEVLFVFGNKKKMFDKEAELVNEDFISESNTYNLKVGGMGGWDYINSDVESRIIKNKKAREITNKVLSSKYGDDWRSILGKIAGKASASRTKDERSLSGKKAAKTTLERYGHGAFYGKKHTNETKAKISKVTSLAQKGKGNSQYGTMWIYSLTEKKSKKIKKEDIVQWNNKGWVKGRKMKF